MMEVGRLKVCALWWMHKTFLLKLLQEFVVMKTIWAGHCLGGGSLSEQIIVSRIAWWGSRDEIDIYHAPQEEKFKNFVVCENVLMAFWDAYSLLLCDFWTKGQYRSILLLNNAASHERNGPDEVKVYHDGICPHTANIATQVLEQFNWE
jgi:hypothetical protein